MTDTNFNEIKSMLRDMHRRLDTLDAQQNRQYERDRDTRDQVKKMSEILTGNGDPSKGLYTTVTMLAQSHEMLMSEQRELAKTIKSMAEAKHQEAVDHIAEMKQSRRVNTDRRWKFWGAVIGGSAGGGGAVSALMTWLKG